MKQFRFPKVTSISTQPKEDSLPTLPDLSDDYVTAWFDTMDDALTQYKSLKAQTQNTNANWSYTTGASTTVSLDPQPVWGDHYEFICNHCKESRERGTLEIRKQYHCTNCAKKIAAKFAKEVEEAKNRRLPAPREFNRYINASDLLEEFIGFLGEHDVRQSEVMSMPLELFIKWLIIRACEEDQEEPNVTLQLPAPKQKTRCLGCGKFMKKDVKLLMHGEQCAQYYFRRQQSVTHIR